MIKLRPYKSSDSAYLLNWLQDERTVAFWKADRFSFPITEVQLSSYACDFDRDPHACIFTALDECGRPVGHCSFRKIDFVKGTAHMGFIITDPAARGKGYGKLMVNQALSFARSLLGLKKVTLGVYDCNLPARRCYETIGFTETDRAHEYTEFHKEQWEYFYMEVIL